MILFKQGHLKHSYHLSSITSTIYEFLSNNPGSLSKRKIKEYTQAKILARIRQDRDKDNDGTGGAV